MSAPVTAVVLTCNEERNIDRCLNSVRGWVGELIVVDSGSDDRTVAIAESLGATVARHPFETHARQWSWALSELDIRTDWVLGLDADQSVTPELAVEIRRCLEDNPNADGFYVARRQIFRGRWIRHGGYYPKYLLKLFRKDRAVVDEAELVDHHFRVRGVTGKLRGDLIEDNRNEADISAWIHKHVHYAKLQAQEEYTRSQQPPRGRWNGSPDERILWVKTRVWDRLPLYVRPFLYFFYRYVLRLGFLDGRQGLVFHFLQGCWYRFLVDACLDDLRNGRTTGDAPPC